MHYDFDPLDGLDFGNFFDEFDWNDDGNGPGHGPA